MTRDRPRHGRTARPDPYAGPRPAAPPSPRALAVLATLPVATVAAASFPVAAAFVLSLSVGVVAGAALGRRYPTVVDRALPVPGGDSAAGAGER